MKLLGMVFGGVGNIPGGNTVIGALMQVFNSAILSVASLMGFYLIVSAIVGTAHDGEVLGKRYSSLWVPIRSVGAVSMMVPASGGFSGVQLLVLWLATQGVGLANSLTSVGYDAVLKQGGFTRPYVGSQDKEARELAMNMAPIAACMTANMDAIGRAEASGDSPEGEITPIITQKPLQAEKMIWSYGFKVVSGGGVHECGRIVITNKAKTGSGGLAESQIDALLSVQSQAVTVLFGKVQDAVTEGFRKPGFDYNTKLNAAAKEYDAQVMAGLSSAAIAVHSQANSEKTRQIEQLKAKGWLGLGESYLQLAKYGTAMTAAVKRAEVSATLLSPMANAVAADRTIGSNFERIVEAVNDSTSGNQSTDTGRQSEEAGGNKGGAKESGSTLWTKFTEIVNVPMLTLVDMFVAAEGENPLLSAKLRGDVILDVAGMLFAAALLASAGVGFFSAAAGTGLMSIITVMAFALIGIGLTLAVYVPMVPYIIWISVLMAWMVAIAEAVIATPLWMMMHLSGEGDGISTREGESGYKFVAAIFLRPALSVIAFFFGSLLLMGIFTFVNESFVRLVKEIQSSTVTGVFLLIGFTGAYAGLCVSLVNKCFALTLTMPSKILQWMGAGLSGDEGIGADAKSEIDAYGGAVTQGATRASQGRPPADPKTPPPTGGTPPPPGGGQSANAGGRIPLNTDTAAPGSKL